MGVSWWSCFACVDVLINSVHVTRLFLYVPRSATLMTPSWDTAMAEMAWNLALDESMVSALLSPSSPAAEFTLEPMLVDSRPKLSPLML